MKRDLKKYVIEYEKRFYGLKNGKGTIYCSDLQQLKEISSSTIDLIANSLKAGIIIGYRLGIKEAKKYKKNN